MNWFGVTIDIFSDRRLIATFIDCHAYAMYEVCGVDELPDYHPGEGGWFESTISEQQASALERMNWGGDIVAHMRGKNIGAVVLFRGIERGTIKVGILDWQTGWERP